MLLCWYALLAQFGGDGVTTEQRNMLSLAIHDFVVAQEDMLSRYCDEHLVNIEAQMEAVLKGRNASDLSADEVKEIAVITQESVKANRKIKENSSEFLKTNFALFFPMVKGYIESHDAQSFAKFERQVQSHVACAK